MPRGRKPKPAVRIHSGEEIPKRQCPANLVDKEREVWEQVIALLDAEGIYSEGDTYLVQTFVVTYTRWIEAELQLHDNPMCDLKTNQFWEYYGISRAMAKEMRSIASEIGLSPTSRARFGSVGGVGSGVSELLSFTARSKDRS